MSLGGRSKRLEGDIDRMSGSDDDDKGWRKLTDKDLPKGWIVRERERPNASTKTAKRVDK